MTVVKDVHVCFWYVQLQQNANVVCAVHNVLFRIKTQVCFDLRLASVELKLINNLKFHLIIMCSIHYVKIENVNK